MTRTVGESRARRSDPVRLEERRRRAAEAIVDEGGEPALVARSAGVSTSTVHRWARAYRAGGAEALSPRTDAHAPPRLSAEQTRHLLRLLVDADPPDHGYGPTLWSRDLVRRLVRDEFRTALSAAATSRLLRGSGIPLRRPQEELGAHHAPGQAALRVDVDPARRSAQPAAVRYVATAQIDGVDVDPARDPARPAVARGPLTVFTEAAPRGAVRFAVRSGLPVAGMLVTFLQRVSADVDTSLLVVIGADPVHDHPEVQAYLASTRGGVRIHQATEGERP